MKKSHNFSSYYIILIEIPLIQ